MIKLTQSEFLPYFISAADNFILPKLEEEPLVE